MNLCLCNFCFGDLVQWVQFLLSMDGALGSIIVSYKTVMVAHAQNPGTSEVKAGGLRVQDSPQLCRMFESSVDYPRFSFRVKRKIKPNF